VRCGCCTAIKDAAGWEKSRYNWVVLRCHLSCTTCNNAWGVCCWTRQLSWACVCGSCFPIQPTWLSDIQGKSQQTDQHLLSTQQACMHLQSKTLLCQWHNATDGTNSCCHHSTAELYRYTQATAQRADTCGLCLHAYMPGCITVSCHNCATVLAGRAKQHSLQSRLHI
jgi:hypothetical protein